MIQTPNSILLVFPGPPASQVQKRILVNLPLSILQLGAYTEQRGYHAIIFDMRIQNYEKIEESLGEIFAVGFSCMTGIQIKWALTCAKWLRQRAANVPFIWGGIHPTLFPRQTAENEFVDCVVKGEGEETLCDVLGAIRLGKSYDGIPGTVFRKEKNIIENPHRSFLEMETLPLPLYDRVDIGRYKNILNAFDYQSSRGCPYRCDFCYNICFNKRSYRFKSARKVVEELGLLVERYHVNKFSFNDDEFFINRDRVMMFCDLVRAQGLNFEWNASCRLNIIRGFSENLMKKIRLSGCRNLNFGAESGCPRILDFIHKDISVDDIIEGTRHTIKNDIVPYLSFMGGVPTETYQESIMSKELISRLWKIDRRVVVNGVFIFNPYPGTPLFDTYAKQGMRLPNNFSEWGGWHFKYDGDLPWITSRHRRLLRVMFYIVRLDFYLKELVFRSGYHWSFRTMVRLLMAPWRFSGWVRWHFNAFGFPFEWYFWAYIMRRFFGFI